MIRTARSAPLVWQQNVGPDHKEIISGDAGLLLQFSFCHFPVTAPISLFFIIYIFGRGQEKTKEN